jgi:hypothetical protein
MATPAPLVTSGDVEKDIGSWRPGIQQHELEDEHQDEF